ncbi:hypothetical protein WT08_17570 [Burkholderia sp. MSMB1552]|nr:hypothetical protein WT08_17570 [Burkholderia sp. MSMB1552]KWZ49737.1 hypothetical protein WS92_19850 [Burkholderia sp. MSMB1588]
MAATGREQAAERPRFRIDTFRRGGGRCLPSAGGGQEIPDAIRRAAHVARGAGRARARPTRVKGSGPTLPPTAAPRATTASAHRARAARRARDSGRRDRTP